MSAGIETVSAKASEVLRVGMYLIINDQECRIVDLSGNAVTMNVNVAAGPAGNPRLAIAYKTPEFREFGTIST